MRPPSFAIVPTIPSHCAESAIIADAEERLQDAMKICNWP